jgi:putative DNA primase/helicase
MTAEELAKALGAQRSGRQWKCKCVAHEDKNPSMIIFDGRESVQVRCMAGCDPLDIIDVLRSRDLWDDAGFSGTGRDRKSISRETVSQQNEQRMRVLARCIFDDAVPIQGTLAQRYFDSRDLWSVAMEIDDIRFHPRCPREQTEQPAVVIAMRSIRSHAITAIQRIFLTRQANKDGKGMMLGTASGAAMQLQPKIGRTLNIAEGLETALAVSAQDHGPVWALGSTSLIQTFPVLDDIDRLTIWADADDPGRKAAQICGSRWLAAGKIVKAWEPVTEGADAADEWIRRNGRL